MKNSGLNSLDALVFHLTYCSALTLFVAPFLPRSLCVTLLHFSNNIIGSRNFINFLLFIYLFFQIITSILVSVLNLKHQIHVIKPINVYTGSYNHLVCAEILRFNNLSKKLCYMIGTYCTLLFTFVGEVQCCIN